MSNLRIKPPTNYREFIRNPARQHFRNRTTIEISPVHTETLPFETPTATYTVTQSRSIFYYYPFWQQWTISTITVFTTPGQLLLLHTTRGLHQPQLSCSPTRPNPCRHGSNFTGAIRAYARRARTATAGLDQTRYHKLRHRGTLGNTQYPHTPRITSRPTRPDPQRFRTDPARTAGIRNCTATSRLNHHHWLPWHNTDQNNPQRH